MKNYISIPPLVSVLVITYNQEKYISHTLDSILEQKTNFEFEIVIGEDCSQDNTYQICLDYQKKYPDIIRLLDNTVNIGLVKNYYRTVMACQGKYIAQCAGDDYWIDDYKLQKQVDFLESNSDYGMIHTNYNYLYQKSGNIEERVLTKIPVGDVYENILFNSFICAATICFRFDLYKKYCDELSSVLNNWLMEDRPFLLFISSKSKVGYLNDVTAVYRKNDNSVTAFKTIKKEIEFIKSSYDVRFYFIENVRTVSDEIKIQLYRKYYKKLLNYYFQSRDNVNAKKTFSLIKNITKPTIGDYLKFYGSINFINNFIISLIIKLIQKK